jgi:hypothetical protein
MPAGGGGPLLTLRHSTACTLSDPVTLATVGPFKLAATPTVATDCLSPCGLTSNEPAPNRPSRHSGSDSAAYTGTVGRESYDHTMPTRQPLARLLPWHNPHMTFHGSDSFRTAALRKIFSSTLRPPCHSLPRLHGPRRRHPAHHHSQVGLRAPTVSPSSRK